MKEKLDIERAIMTIEMVAEGSELLSEEDLVQALTAIGVITDVLFARLVEMGKADIAWSWVTRVIQPLPSLTPGRSWRT